MKSATEAQLDFIELLNDWIGTGIVSVRELSETSGYSRSFLYAVKTGYEIPSETVISNLIESIGKIESGKIEAINAARTRLNRFKSNDHGIGGGKVAEMVDCGLERKLGGV